MMHLALWWMLVSSDVTTGGTSTATPALKCHYFVKDHQAIAKNTTKTASHFYESLSNNLTSRLDNRSLVHVKGLALSNGWINYPTDLFLNGSNITSSFSWSTSWSKLLPELTSKMVLQVVEQVGKKPSTARSTATPSFPSITSQSTDHRGILQLGRVPHTRRNQRGQHCSIKCTTNSCLFVCLLDLTWIHFGWLAWLGRQRQQQ